MVVECSCHATLGRSLEFISPSEARCSRTEFVSFRHWEEDYDDATMCSECWPHPRGYGVDPEYYRCCNACMCTCDSCRVVLQELVDSTDIDQLLDMDVPAGLAAQTPHQANPPPDNWTDPVEVSTPEGSPERAPQTLRPTGSYVGWLPPPHISMNRSDPNATMIDVECNCHYDRHRGVSCTTRRRVRLDYLSEDGENAMLCEGCYPQPRQMVANRIRLTPCQCI